MGALRTIAVLLASSLAAAPALAHPDAEHPWDATWFGGFEGGGDGVQLIVAGDEVIGFFYGGDYVDVSSTEPLGADGSLSFTWVGGHATLSRDGDARTVTITLADAAGSKVIKITEDH